MGEPGLAEGAGRADRPRDHLDARSLGIKHYLGRRREQEVATAGWVDVVPEGVLLRGGVGGSVPPFARGVGEPIVCRVSEHFLKHAEHVKPVDGDA